MRTPKLVHAMVAMAALLLPVSGSAQSEVLVEGTLVDSACYIGMKMTDNDHGEMRGCGSACLRGGQPAGLVTDDGTMYTIVAPSGKLADHVGHRVRITGMFHTGAIMATKAEVNQDGEYTEIDVKGMM